MNGTERRDKILEIIMKNETKISGTALAEMFQVSRQVIVQDIALLRAEGYEIISTNRGYLCKEKTMASRVFYVYHEDDRILEELNLIVDSGATVKDVFVNHEIYGNLKAELEIDSRKKAKEFVQNIENGSSTPLNKITSGYHYHTVIAEKEEILEEIEAELRKCNFLVKKSLQN